MSALRPNWQALVALVATLYSLTALPLHRKHEHVVFPSTVAAILAAGAVLSMLRLPTGLDALVLMVTSFGAAAAC